MFSELRLSAVPQFVLRLCWEGRVGGGVVECGRRVEGWQEQEGGRVGDS